MKKQISSKIFIILTIISSILIFENELFYDGSNKAGFGSINLKQNSLIISDPIHIYDTQDWIDLKNAGKCTGEGTQINPYIISNLKIDAKGSWSCISLDHQIVYFKILNCELFNSSGSGILMYASDNAEILYNNISANENGINIDIPPSPPGYHSNILIQGNNIFNNTKNGIYGLEIYDSEISDNDIFHNGKYGIYFAGHNERVNIINNNISYNSYYSMYLISCNDFEIRGNTINYNGGGIWLDSSDNNIINENNINYNEGSFFGPYNHATYFYYSDGNTVENNNISDNGYYEFDIEDSNNNIIRYNNIIETLQNFYGISGASSGNIIENNNVQYDDDYEYNDFFRDAIEIDLGIYDNLIALDDDWYRVFIDQPSQLIVSTNYLLSDDPLDLYLYNSIGLLLNYSNSGLPNRTISYLVNDHEYYYIRVFNGINLNYQLRIYTMINLPPNIIINSPFIGEVFGLNAPTLI